MAALQLLDLKKFEILMVLRASEVNTHQHAKFHGNKLNHCRDTAV